jgi:hypothetical protein
MNVKSNCEKAEAADGEAGGINMSEAIYKHKNV